MISGKVIIRDQVGLHLRPAKELSKVASDFKCSIKLKSEKTTANVKSIISLLGACVKTGSEVEIICDGEDEEEAFKAIMHILSID